MARIFNIKTCGTLFLAMSLNVFTHQRCMENKISHGSWHKNESFPLFKGAEKPVKIIARNFIWHWWLSVVIWPHVRSQKSRSVKSADSSMNMSWFFNLSAKLTVNLKRKITLLWNIKITIVWQNICKQNDISDAYDPSWSYFQTF